MPNDLIEYMISNLKSVFSHLSSSFTQLDVWALVIFAIAVVVFIAILTIYGIRAHRRTPLSGRNSFITKTARAKTALNPNGTVQIDGELWSATLQEGEVQAGEEVVIIKIDNLKLWVIKK